MFYLITNGVGQGDLRLSFQLNWLLFFNSRVRDRKREMENVENSQIEFTESTNKSPKLAIKSRVWRKKKTGSHTAAHGDLALKVLLKNPKEKLGKQVQEAMCSKYRCFLAILQDHILAFRSISAPGMSVELRHYLYNAFFGRSS